MKANKAPEKIYINIDSVWGSIFVNYDKNDTDNIEYVREDAFIEKACEKLKKCMYDNLIFQGRLHRKEVIDNFVENFKSYMKGG